MKKSPENFPQDLKTLVNKCITVLGEVIQEEAGKKFFLTIESIRKSMVLYRSASATEQEQLLKKLYQKLKIKNADEQSLIAHSFTLMLELINSTETAYRTYRLQSKKLTFRRKKQNSSLVYVLTAHPTEARTSENIEVFHRIQSLALRILNQTGEEDYLLSVIKHNLKLAWLLPITLHKKPEVLDEANHLFSIILRPDIFDVLLRANRDLGKVRVRTWVGGDKDGHPGVDEKVMLKCLQASRNHFVTIVLRVLESFAVDLGYLNIPKLNLGHKNLIKLLNNIKKMNTNDSMKVREFKSYLYRFDQLYQKEIGHSSPRIEKLISTIELFPGLVIPIELREDSEIIVRALTSSKDFAITKMLKALKKLAGNGKVTCYAQGMIISMCESYQDIINTQKLMTKAIGSLKIRVIPLFETQTALANSGAIIKELLSNKKVAAHIKKSEDGKLEIMLGYSDSSKGMGVLASRLAIAKTMRNLDTLIQKQGLTPIFFHGSGGSIDRGGGSVQEQTAWWPKSALEVYKATIQGEMVERNFASPEVTLSGMDKILQNLDRTEHQKGDIEFEKIVEEFALAASEEYIKKISDPKFFHMVEAVTPYSYLNVLKLGSRPTKRAKAAKLDFSSIRAIPWVLCWTQTRILFPTWWGIGTSWEEFKKDSKNIDKLKKAYKKSYIFSSYIRALGFTLSKVDLQIFKLYLLKSNIDAKKQKEFFNEFSMQFKLSSEFVKNVTGEKDLLWFRPWLKESINYRSSMINPLNALQIIAQATGNQDLIRKTTAGISSGMLTTG